MRFSNWICKGSVGTFRIFYFLLALLIILVASYVLGGYSFLVKGAWGSDLGMALSMATWVDKYFPRVPFWYPLAGGGVSFTHSYPVFSFYLVVILKRLTDLNLIEAFRVLGFSSVPLMALGIYTFVALRFKNQTAALIASILYLLSPIAWVWLFDWGFYADSVSHMFVMPAVIFWDLFFTSFLESKNKMKSRIFLILTAVFVSLALLTHFVTGLGILTLFGFYVVGYTIKSKERKKVFVRGIVAFALVGFLTIGSTAFATLPFYRYTKIAGGMRGGAYEAYKQSKMIRSHVLGFRALTEEFIAARHITFPAAVSLLALLGVLLSFQGARFLTLALFTIFALSLPFNPDFLYWISQNLPLPLLYGVFDKRPNLTLLRFVLPTLAALGAIGIFKIPLFWLKGKIGGFSKGVFATLAGIALVAFALYYFGDFPNPFDFPFNYGARGIDFRNVWEETKDFCLLNDKQEEECFEFKKDGCMGVNRCMQDEECLQNFQVSGKKEWCDSYLSSYFLPLGVQTWCEQAEKRELAIPQLCYLDQLTGDQVRSFWQKCQEEEGYSGLCGLMFEPLQEQLSPANWPEFAISASPRYEEELKSVLDRVAEENPQARLDFSVLQGQYGMWAPYYNRDRDLSQIHIYAVGSTLIKHFWAQLTGVFYSNSAFHGGSVDLMNNLTRWFGINYVSFNQLTDSKLFQEAGWELVDGWWGRGVLKFPQENKLVDLSTKPSVLVIGQNSVDAYLQIFRLGTNGLFPYEDAVLVWGKSAVDDYKLPDLIEFDTLLLHGYTYGNQKRADELLENYVADGGSVFIDTGWQYTTPDWETEEDMETHKIIPFNRLAWKDLGRTGDFVLEDSEAGNEVDVSKFTPLVYGDKSWSVSTSEKTNLKSWANVVLSAKGYPLIVKGEIGKGRVIWSGMNILSRIKRGETVNYQELKLMTNLFSWLTEGKDKRSYSVSYKRDHPDKVEFTIQENMPTGGSLYWKEAYHPDFHATLVTNNNQQTPGLKTYRAGPRFVLIKVPKVEIGDKIVYEYHQPFSEKASSYLSFLTLLFLPAIVIEGPLRGEKSIFLRLVQAVERKLHYLFFELWKKPFEWWRKEEGE